MPQPESCSSDWRIIGFSAASSSCRIETGSDATQPSTRHMWLSLFPRAHAWGRKIRSARLCPSEAERRGTEMVEPKRIWWARPRKLCALERPGGGGRSHRPDRRAGEIEYLKEHGVRFVISTMKTRHNLADYEAAGLAWHHLPVESCASGADALEELLPLLKRELRHRGAVAVHGNRHTDFVAAVCAAHLHDVRGTAPEDSLSAAA